MKAALIFPHQLFKDTSLWQGVEKVFLIEDHLYFNQYKFHKAKLVLHRASMKYYEELLAKSNYKVSYIECENSDLKALFNTLKKDGVSELLVVEPTDFLLRKRLVRFADNNAIKFNWKSNPNFLTSNDQLKERLKKGKSGYFMANFYKEQRKQLDILMEDNEPVGGQWSFDEENRKKLPKDIELPETHYFQENQFVAEAKSYVNKHFSENPGRVDDFNYPTTHEEANDSLQNFLKNRMKLFGDYEDAIAKNESVLFHSVLTPALNIGLINPDEVVRQTLEFHQRTEIPINSLEGFVRQVIGWREFMRGIYEFEGVFERTNNHFNHTRKIPPSFYDGTTGISPIDQTIKKIIKTGYCHHIERLMILGNFMLLCEFDPDEVYQWFMELFIDAYDWVMVPNVYGMTQYADGGLITTKPYVSSSNYILKMSDYTKGAWCKVWDGLYWHFIHKHQEQFSENQRMSFMVAMLNKMDKNKLENHLKEADHFFKVLDGKKKPEELKLFS
ncbi:cryptochrome/photolyase family protein [Fulvivirga lutea]|uniref:Cryptochrome/photolyase family protein n=1 Tax=Fulvivirga lutea TaxID=2810512 RepID=A0A974WGZ6_9BACT|nr:cryptochrome/photolyase family protein [Fulvivirga lutea]QSE98161.1 cryptochrome/photolyase family protein [Fulvivirga lutea]